MSGTMRLPSMFYLDPGIDTSKLPMMAEFECVFCPEFTTGDGWVIIRFLVARHWIPHNKTWVRGVAQISKKAITEAEALELYTEVREGVLT